MMVAFGQLIMSRVSPMLTCAPRTGLGGEAIRSGVSGSISTGTVVCDAVLGTSQKV